MHWILDSSRCEEVVVDDIVLSVTVRMDIVLNLDVGITVFNHLKLQVTAIIAHGNIC